MPETPIDLRYDESLLEEKPPQIDPTIAKVNFVLYRGTLQMIQRFQEDFPDIDFHEASSHINQAIISMIKDYRQWHRK